jgi:hypothetical protein
MPLLYAGANTSTTVPFATDAGWGELQTAYVA